MQEFNMNLNIQTMIALFFLVLCFVVGVAGYLLWRFEFLDGKSFYFSRTVGVVILVSSIVLGFASALMLLYVRMML